MGLAIAGDHPAPQPIKAGGILSTYGTIDLILNAPNFLNELGPSMSFMSRRQRSYTLQLIKVNDAIILL